MKIKNIGIMACALVILVGIAMMQQRGDKQHKKAVGPLAATTLLEGIDLNQINSLNIQQKDEAVQLEKTDGKWVVKSLYNYPVQFDKLARALRDVANLKLGAPLRTDNVDAIEFGFGEGYKKLELKTAHTSSTVDIGARRQASKEARWSNQHFIRTNDEAPIYLVDSDFRDFSTVATDWIQKDLLNVSSSEIVAVKRDGLELKLEGADWTLSDLDATKEELQVSAANNMRSALQSLNCLSVVDPKKTEAELGFTNAVVFTAQTTNSLMTVKLGGEADGGRYARFEGDIPDKLVGWTYIIPAYKAKSFLTERSDLVSEKSPDEETETQAEGSEASPTEQPTVAHTEAVEIKLEEAPDTSK